MSINLESYNLSREHLLAENVQLKRDKNCLTDDLILFKLMTDNYEKYFNQINDNCSSINDNCDLDQLKTKINILNKFKVKKTFVKCFDKIDSNLLNHFLKKSEFSDISTQTEDNENISPFIAENIQQKVFKESDSQTIIRTNNVSIQTDCQQITDQLSATDVSDNQSEGIDCDNNLMDLSDDETDIESCDQNVEQIDLNSQQMVQKTPEKQNPIKVLTKDNSIDKNVKKEIVLNNNMTDSPIVISNVRSLRKRVKTNYNYELNDNDIEISDNSDNVSKEDQMSDKTDDISDEYSSVKTPNVLKKSRIGCKTERTFKCDVNGCEGAFTTMTSLKRHKNKHLAKFKCDVDGCQYVGGSQSHITVHKSTFHTDYAPFECTVKNCDQKFKTNGNLRAHQRRHHNLFVCEQNDCKQLFNKSNDYENHKLEAHIKPTIFKCDWEDCCRTFASKRRLRYHKNLHTARIPCKWDGCSYLATEPYLLRSHELRIHSDQSDRQKFKCLIKDCERIFSDEKQLKTHQLSAHPQEFDDIPWLRCPESGCDFKTKAQRNFNLHKLNKHQKSVICPDCQKGFGTKSLFTQHWKFVHSTDIKDKFQCEWYGCERLFNTKKQMTDHMNVHTAAVTHRCDWPGCDKTFILVKSLGQHKARHLGKGRYVCQHCEYGSTNPIRFKNHLKAHQNQSNN